MAKTVVPARGMRDILPAEKAKRDYVLETIRSTYRGFGFTEIETPAIEPLSRIRSNQGGENESMIYEIMRRDLDRTVPIAPSEAADLALRYDLTVPLTRFYASHCGELPTVFRSLQIGPVWRAERPQKGRFRQFMQCDIDLVGEPGIVAEIDLLVATLTAFQDLGISQEITLLINDRRVLHGMLEAAGFHREAIGDALIALDKLEKIGVAGVSAEIERKGLASQETISRLIDCISGLREQTGPDDLPLQKGEFTVGDGGSTVSLHDLPTIVTAVREILPWARVAFDASLVRGMGYYTGPIFELAHSGSGSSVAGGGRYDSVVGKWLGKDVPACGFSIGFERIIDLLPDVPRSQRRVALFYDDATEPVALLKLRQELRAGNAQVALVRPPRKINARFLDGLAAGGFTHFYDPRPTERVSNMLRELGHS